MIANRYQINLSTISSGATDIYLNIPLSLESQEIGKSELIQTKFVDVETEKAINPILDYDKVRFLPVNSNNVNINKITYALDLTGSTKYGSIGFDNDDIKFERNNFKQTFLYLAFYDTDNPMNQRLVSYITLFSEITPSNLLPNNETQTAIYGSVIGLPGQTKPAIEIPLQFTLSSPIFNPRGFNEGYHLYDYKDELDIGQSKYLYMKASFKNAKTGKTTGLMVKNTSQLKIDEVIKEVYTRYKLFRTITGYYYQIDNTYQIDTTTGVNNVSISNAPSDILINLYQIQVV
jgi:hypothetical protein